MGVYSPSSGNFVAYTGQPCRGPAQGAATAVVTGLQSGRQHGFKAFSSYADCATDLYNANVNTTDSGAAGVLGAAPVKATTLDGATLTTNTISGGVKLTLANWRKIDGDWWYRPNVIVPHANSPLHGADGCRGPVAGGAIQTDDKSLPPLVGTGAYYLFTAYSAAGCHYGTVVAYAQLGGPYSGPSLTVAGVTDTAATLRIADHSEAWWYQGSRSVTACTPATAGTASVNLSGLDAGASHTFRAYDKAGCGNADQIASATFSTLGPVSVSNLDSSSGDSCVVGTPSTDSNSNLECASGFTTGAAAGSYTLNSITAKFVTKIGSPFPIQVNLRAASGENPAASVIPNTTFSGESNPSDGEFTYTCAGAGCKLSPSTTYYVVMSTAHSGSIHSYGWRTTESDDETQTPPGNGWTIANDSRSGDLATSEDKAAMFKVSAVARPDLAASNVKSTTATLALTNFAGNWSLKRAAPAGGDCKSKGTTATERLTGLTPGTTYTYRAYSDPGCTAEIANATFTTPAKLTVGNVTATTATLTLTGHAGNWHYKADREPDNDCKGPVTGKTKTVTGLASKTAYVYSAYKDGSCESLLHQASAFTTVVAALAVSNKRDTTATLNLSGHAGAWWYNANIAPYKTCRSESGSSVNLAGLTAGAEYVFKAFDDSDCSSTIASAKFTTYALTSSDVTATSATLTIANHSGDWHYRANEHPHAACSPAQTGTSASLTGLVPGTRYTYAAYGDSTCSDANKLAENTFTTGGLSVSNLGQTPDDIIVEVGVKDGNEVKAAIQFVTGSKPNGYTLHSVTARFGAAAGNPGDLTFALHDKGILNTIPADTPIADATFGGSNPADDGGVVTHVCSGNGCQLKPQYNYHIVATATAAASGSNYYRWSRVTTNEETRVQAGNLWEIWSSPVVHRGPGWLDQFGKPVAVKIAATLNPELGVSKVTDNSARLTIANYSGAWRYKSTTTGQTTCTAAPAGASSVDVTDLNANTSYAFTAYSDSGCTARLALPAQFKTLNFTTSKVTDSSATLTIANYSGAWRYKSTTTSKTTCTAVAANTSAVDVSGLNANTAYTFSAYSDSGCTTANRLATAAQFTTLGLTVGDVTSTSATLTIANYSGAWHYKSTTTGKTTCIAVAANTGSVDVSGLNANTAYTFSAYSDSGCTTANRLATAAEFKTLRLTTSKVTDNSASLTLANHSGAWHYKSTTTGKTTCTAVSRQHRRR